MQESKWEKCIAATCNVSFPWIMELLDFFQNGFSDWHPWANFRILYWIKCHIILFSSLLLSSGWSGQTWAQYGYFKLTVCAFQISLVELTENLWEICYIYKMFLRQHLSHSWAECVTSVQKKISHFGAKKQSAEHWDYSGGFLCLVNSFPHWHQGAARLPAW